MPQVEHQLREYFDAGVERVSADDVIVRAAVGKDVVEPRRRPSPAWVAVGAFALTLVVFGGAFIAIGLLEQAGVNVAGGGLTPVSGSVGSLALWPIAAVGAGGLAALAAWLLRTRSGEGRDGDGERAEHMETMEKPQVEKPTTQQLATRNRWLMVGVVVLVVALLALGAWVLFGTRANSPNAAPAEVAEVMDDYVAAWNNYDAGALEALVTPEYRMWTDDPSFDHDMESVGSYLMPYIAENDWHITSGPSWYAVGGDGIWFVSGEGAVITGTVYADGDGVQNSVFRVVERDGTLLIDSHFNFGSDLAGKP